MADILSTCKERLRNDYETEFARSRLFCCERKIYNFPLKDYYMDITVGKMFVNENEKEDTELHEVFFDKNNTHQTILLSGHPGLGKSALCKKIAYDWSRDEESTAYIKHFDLVVVINLRDLGTTNVKDAILDRLFRESRDEGERVLQEQKLNLLIILDEFDEKSNKESVLKFITEESFHISHGVTILLTCRQWACKYVKEYMHCHFQIYGFNFMQRAEYINLMFRDVKDESKQMQFIQKLLDPRFHFQFETHPLFIQMLCCIFKRAKINEIRRPIDLFIRMFGVFTESYLCRYGNERNFETGKHFIGENLLIRLGKLSHSLDKISRKILREHFSNEKEFNFIVGMGILVESSYSDNDRHYDFLLDVFKDFLIALAICTDSSFLPDKNLSWETKLFILGHLEYGPFPENVKYYFSKCLVSVEFMIAAHKEIKFNWEELCSIVSVAFDLMRVENLMNLLCLYKFSKIYCRYGLCLDYDKDLNDNPLYYFDYLYLPESLTLLLYFDLQRKKKESFFDIRKPTSLMLRFLLEVPRKCKIYFYGIRINERYERCFIGTRYAPGHAKFCKFLVDDSVEQPPTKKRRLQSKVNEDVVILKTDSQIERINVIISKQQYETLLENNFLYFCRDY
ncbi:uncharacterized protein [Centruroides vittatus]|uniref:uncharacterized protein n=1 Tax=Centruroides vittatus TaxID=120091 RepID=UPI00350F1829